MMSFPSLDDALGGRLRATFSPAGRYWGFEELWATRRGARQPTEEGAQDTSRRAFNLIDDVASGTLTGVPGGGGATISGARTGAVVELREIAADAARRAGTGEIDAIFGGLAAQQMILTGRLLPPGVATPIASAAPAQTVEPSAAAALGLEEQLGGLVERVRALPAEERFTTLVHALDARGGTSHGDTALAVLEIAAFSDPAETAAPALRQALDMAVKHVAPDVAPAITDGVLGMSSDALAFARSLAHAEPTSLASGAARVTAESAARVRTAASVVTEIAESVAMLARLR